jgi:hypothetical protein
MGQPTRVPPPATGSYSAPNNYMGGSPPIGQVNNQAAPYDSFSSSVSGTGPVGSGVSPTAYVEQNASSGALSPLDSTSQPSLSPTLGGMRVIDMTQAPPPPGYYPQYQAPQLQGQQYPQAYPSVQNPNVQNFGGQNAVGIQQPSYDIPQQSYDASQNGYPMQTIQVPGPAEIASGQGALRIQPNVGYGPSASIASGHEFPLQPSVTEPSFQAGNQFPPSQPSTDPIGNGFETQQDNLPWRRPGTQY